MKPDDYFLALAAALFLILVLYPAAPCSAMTLAVVLIAALVLLGLPFRRH